ncbi:MAG: zinc-dependent peptidase [Burkholderiaceae bacterium]|nr:MAG: zinc-dependent peptidase [Burkholderiaceae bacterium]
MLKKIFKRAPRTVSIPDTLWLQVVRQLPWYTWLQTAEQIQLRALTGQFLARKSISAAGGMQLTDTIRVSIATQACLPVLHLGLEYYQGWQEIIVYPGEFVVHSEETDEAGVVHEYFDLLAGEAWHSGPVVLSWDASDLGVLNPGFNVVLHEFAHKLDLRNGAADGVPLLKRTLHPGLSRKHWITNIQSCYADFKTRVEVIENSIPPDIDPTSEQADPYYEDLPLDAYAAEDISEFFAVCSEIFFMTPSQLLHNYPVMYQLLAEFYLQDPIARMRT